MPYKIWSSYLYLLWNWPWPRHRNLTYLAPLTLEIRSYSPKSNQFIWDHHFIIPWSFIKIGKEVWAVPCTQKLFWFVTFWPWWLRKLDHMVHNLISSSDIPRGYTHQVLKSNLAQKFWLNRVHKLLEATDDLCEPGDLDIKDGCLKVKSLIQLTKKGWHTKFEVDPNPDPDNLTYLARWPWKSGAIHQNLISSSETTNA